MSEASSNPLRLDDPPARPSIAAFLALASGPTAYIYCGRIRRGLTFALVSWLTNLPGVALLLYVPVDRLCVLLAIAVWAGLWIFMFIDAVRIARRNKALPSGPLWGCLLMYVVASLGALAEALVMREVWAEAYALSSRNMEDTLLDGDRFLVDKLAGSLASPGHATVVAYYVNGPGSPIFGGRVIGLPGDQIEIRDEQVFRNGSRLDEPYAKYEGEKPPPQIYPESYGPETVPAGGLFIMGDHRRRSRDSRDFSSIPQRDVLGPVRMLYWSHDPPPRGDSFDAEPAAACGGNESDYASLIDERGFTRIRKTRTQNA